MRGANDATVGIVQSKIDVSLGGVHTPIGKAITLLNAKDLIDHRRIVAAAQLGAKKLLARPLEERDRLDNANLCLLLVHDRNELPFKLKRKLSAEVCSALVGLGFDM